jgi:hypothetical protein
MQKKETGRKPESVGHHPYVQRHIDAQKQTPVSVTDKLEAQTIPYEDIKAPEKPETPPSCPHTGALHNTRE